MEDDILTIEEVARYLRVSERTVYDWAQKGEIPSGKIGTVWRFKKAEIEKWVNDRLSSSSKPTLQNNQIQVKSILSPDRIIFLNPSTKHDALLALADNLSTAPQVKASQELSVEILKREGLMSTAIGRGIAIPHVRLASVTDLVMAVGVCRKPITDYQTIDDQSVDLLFMIAAAYNQHSLYLKTISHFCSKLKQEGIHEALVNAATEEEVFNLLA